jgi:hypothetical protein
MYSKKDPDELYEVELSDEERCVLFWGLEIWGGPTRMTDPLAVALGFDDTNSLHSAMDELADRVRVGTMLSRKEWAQVVALTEIAFSSNIFGAGWEWCIVTGLPDAETIVLLRTIQDKFLGFTLKG